MPDTISLNSSEWESLCTRCGMCCQLKDAYPEGPRLSHEWCAFFDRKTRSCSVYPMRHSLSPICGTMQEALERRMLPNSCPYTRLVPGYFTRVVDALYIKTELSPLDLS